MKTLGFGGTIFSTRVLGSRFLLSTTAVVVVLVFADFVLRCVGGDCAVGSWRGPRNPFRLPTNHLFEGELLSFEGEPVALEGGEPLDAVKTADTP